MATELGMFSMTHESITVPMGRDRKICTTMIANQIAELVIVPPEKKQKTKQTEVAERGLRTYFFLLAFSWQIRYDAKGTAEEN